MRVHLLDGTYELFRHYFGQPPRSADDGTEVGATYGVVTSVVGMLEGGVTHLGVATDHVIESFRNELWPGYKTGDEVPDDLSPSSSCSRTRSAPSGSWSGRWSRSKPTTRWPRRRRSLPTTRASSRWSSARRTRTWPNAWWAAGWSSSTAART